MSTATVDTTHKCSRVMIVVDVVGVPRDLRRVEGQRDKIFANVTQTPSRLA
jgi:hypothetical protein